LCTGAPDEVFKLGDHTLGRPFREFKPDKNVFQDLSNAGTPAVSVLSFSTTCCVAALLLLCTGYSVLVLLVVLVVFQSVSYSWYQALIENFMVLLGADETYQWGATDKSVPEKNVYAGLSPDSGYPDEQ